MTEFKDATAEEVNKALQDSWKAFEEYRKLNLKQRAQLLLAIAEELKAHAEELVQTANQETHLDEARLTVELNRTVFQLTSYAQACEEGTWLDIRIDTADTNRNPPKPDLRKMLVPLGPVVVFGASNFPFAYSTAGGDTACALAAGCTVVVKAHQAHAHTSQLVANAVQQAAKQCNLPGEIFIHLHGASFAVGKALVEHPFTKAVAFTGSFEGGKALFQLANQRNVPIPVFAEMGSTNPVFLMPQKLKEDAVSMAGLLATSINQSVGQFCTNPGLIVAVEGPDLEHFKTLLAEKIKQVTPAKMLHKGIAKSFHANRSAALAQEGVHVLAISAYKAGEDESLPTLAATTAAVFLQHPLLHKEVFGPYSLLIQCKNTIELLQVAEAMEGQLTTTMMATDNDVQKHTAIVNALQNCCGRFILNGVPTGVEVALAMHHGGPYPATTDSRFTSVGADGIKRFARPVCFQNWPDYLLADELKNNNPLQLWRTVNNKLTKDILT